MTKLSVNINKIATLRNSRGGFIPDVVKAAVDVQLFGADGVTVHPRPDERHITRKDVHNIRPVIKTEFNIEGYPSREFIDLVKSVKPHQVTLVPDPPEAITSSSGWDTIAHFSFLQEVISEFKESGIRTSIFIDPVEEMIAKAVETDTDRVELYTEPYATGYAKDREKAVAPFVVAANLANKLGMKVNAGHDLNLENLKYFNECIPFLKEVSIGHALIADALYMGLERTIASYKALLKKN
ncbi:pyridoxine 5'-phosphate synthase [Natronoflexus pectinivorans]|uniref:Pyridoxine 5'-phosphate synthase n=1 Tax=Natronoflexus pectinivorans TaxID=682526 RepID=A0A4V2RWW1_9BACT|nr:pyridoxine 5'-phosphate synthase [Natronoflexus pectinivorans]TCO10401.1 pyridoxine 5-phosphate synthase [Natronoflexus pectinivorans]